HTRSTRDWSSDVCSSDLGITAYPKVSEFDRIVEALIFTAFAQTSTFLMKLGLLAAGAHWRVVGTWSDDVARAWSVILGGVFGLRSEERRVGRGCGVRWGV